MTYFIESKEKSKKVDVSMHFLGLEVGKFCGADGVDDWSQEKWISEIEKNQVQGYIFSKKNFHHPNNIPRIIFISFLFPFSIFFLSS